MLILRHLKIGDGPIFCDFFLAEKLLFCKFGARKSKSSTIDNNQWQGE
jgi:hypothetical protein